MEYEIHAYNRHFDLLMAKIDTAYHDAAQKLGMSDSAMLILYELCISGGSCLLGDITAGVSKQTINSALRKLEAGQIVHSELFEGKKKKLSLTEKGRQLAEETVRKVIRIENEIFGGWSQEERDLYIGLTQKYLTSFREKIEEL